MAVYPYYPNYQAYYPVSYQPMMQPQAQPQATHQSTTGIIWVSGLNEAQMYPVAPNNAVALWEQSGKVIYLKSADATGKPTMRVYDLIERAETPVSGSKAKGEDLPAYATKDDLGAIVGAVKALTSEIEQMKGDLYGVAGRKKVKKEAPDDDT